MYSLKCLRDKTGVLMIPFFLKL